MPLEFDVVLGDGAPGAITLEGRPANPEACYLLQGVSGHEARALRETIDAVADGDGSYLGPQAREGIALSVQGVIVGATRIDRAGRDRALGALLRGGVHAAPLSVRLAGVEGYPEDLAATMRIAQPYVAARDGAGPGSGRVQAFAFALRSASPSWAGASLQSAEVIPPEQTDGLSFPFSFPFSFGASSDPGTIVTNAGDDHAWPTLRLYGPARGPIAENLTTGQALHFPGLSLEADRWIDLDPRPGRRTAYLNGNPGASRYGDLDTAASSWWGLAPGANALRYRATEYGEGARMVVTWHNAYA